MRVSRRSEVLFIGLPVLYGLLKKIRTSIAVGHLFKFKGLMKSSEELPPRIKIRYSE